MKPFIDVWLVALVVGPTWACSGAGAPEPSGDSPSAATTSAAPAHTASSGGKVAFQAPAGWISEPPNSRMRVAQYRLPGANDDAEDASLVIYYFGPGQGGSVKANLDRWIGQMEQPDGSPSSEKAATQKMTVNGLNVTLLDVTGTYRGEIRPGSGRRHNNPNARLRAAVVETPQGPYFVKLIGPEKTVSRWDEAFMEFVKSFQYK